LHWLSCLAGEVLDDEVGLGVAPEGAVAPGAGAEYNLVVQRCDRRPDERTHPEDPLQMNEIDSLFQDN
jgi:hypothetical protein